MQSQILNSKYFKIITGLLLLATIGLSSCKTKQPLIEEAYKPRLSKQELIDNFLKKPDYTYASGKAKIDIASAQGSVKGTLYLRTIKDSIIWIAVKKLSVEGGRALITKDSIFLINRLEKSYQKHALDDIQRSYGVTADFGYIQDLILGLTPSIDTTTYWATSMQKDTLNISSSINNILHNFFLDSNTGEVIGGTFKEKFGADGSWSYDNYKFEIDSIPVPADRQLDIYMANGDALNIKINISELEIDVPKSIRFSIPSHYLRTY